MDPPGASLATDPLDVPSLDPSDYAEMLLKLALTVTHSSVGHVYVASRDGDYLEAIALDGDDIRAPRLPLERGSPPSVVVRVFKRGRAIIVNDVHDYQRMNGYIPPSDDPSREPFAELAVPIEQGPFASTVPPRRLARAPVPIGVINVERVRPRDSAVGDYTPSDLAALQAIAFLFGLRRAGSLTTVSAESLAALTQRTGLLAPRMNDTDGGSDIPSEVPLDLRHAKESLQLILGQIYRFTRSTSVTIRVVTADEKALARFVAVPEQRMDDAAGVIALSARNSVNAWVVRSGLPCYIPDLAVKPTSGFGGLDGVLTIAGRPEPRSELCIPIAVHGRVIGTLNLESAQISDYPDDVAAVVRALAEQAGLAIARARRADEWALFQVHAAQVRKAHRVLAFAGTLKEWLAAHADDLPPEALSEIEGFADAISSAADPDARPATRIEADGRRSQAASVAVTEAIKRSHLGDRVDWRGAELLTANVSELAADVLTIALTELIRNAGKVCAAAPDLAFAVRLRCSMRARGVARYLMLAVSNEIAEPLTAGLVEKLFREPIRRERVHMVGSYVRSVGGALYIAENGRNESTASDLDRVDYFTVVLEVPLLEDQREELG